jgi:hypothetical protein
MGGGYYDRDVYTSKSTSSKSYGYTTTSYSAKAAKDLGRSSLHKDLLPKNLKGGLVTNASFPIVIAFDVTGSMGDWAKVIYDKLPMFWGQLNMKGYLEDAAVSFAAIGDANSDSAPTQVCPFAADKTLDDHLKKIYLEGNGGGQHCESYEVMAYYYARHCSMPKAVMPLFFFIGDEDYYKTVEQDQIVALCDSTYKGGDIKSSIIFKELAEKFQTFLIHKHYDYYDTEIVASWKKAVGPERVLPLEDPKAIVDVILGCIALMSKTRDLDDYLVDMKGRDQTEDRITLVKDTLTKLSDITSVVTVEDNLPTAAAGKTRKGASKRL